MLWGRSLGLRGSSRDFVNIGPRVGERFKNVILWLKHVFCSSTKKHFLILYCFYVYIVGQCCHRSTVHIQSSGGAGREGGAEGEEGAEGEGLLWEPGGGEPRGGDPGGGPGVRLERRAGGDGRLPPLLLPGPGQRGVRQCHRWLGIQVTVNPWGSGVIGRLARCLLVDFFYSIGHRWGWEPSRRTIDLRLTKTKRNNSAQPSSYFLGCGYKLGFRVRVKFG